MSSLSCPSWSLDKAGPYYPQPFCDYASTIMPETIYTALKWAEFLVISDGTFLSAISRIAAYFTTSLIIGDEDTNHDEQKRWLDFSTNDQDILSIVYLSAIDALSYGNSIISIIQPFKAYLYCGYSSCGANYALDYAASSQAGMAYKFDNGKYILTCKRCGNRGNFKRNDVRVRDFSKFRINRWSPHEIRIIPGILGSKPTYRWMIPEYVRRLVRSGRVDILTALPQEVIQACITKDHEFEFAESEIIHFKLPSLAGVQLGEWGFPPPIHHLRHTWLIRMLNRQNEGIASDYILPNRIVTPEKSGPGVDDDILANIGMDSFARRFQSMLDQKRRDPTTWMTMPFPIKYILAGGEARNLVPFELMDQAYSTWMDAIGAPVELFKGTLNMQAMSQGLRLFETRHRPLVRGLNRLIQHIFNRFSALLRWQPVRASLDRITLADDLEKKSIRLQLAASRLISPSSILESLGMSFPGEQRKLVEDDKFVANLQKEMQEESDENEMSNQLFLSPLQRLQLMQQTGQQEALAMLPGGGSQAGGAAPAGAAPAGQPGDPNQQSNPYASTGGVGAASDYANMSPPELQAEATRLAQTIAPMDPSTRRNQMNQLKQRSELIWKIVSKEVEQFDNQAKRIGGQEFMARFRGG